MYKIEISGLDKDEIESLKLENIVDKGLLPKYIGKETKYTVRVNVADSLHSIIALIVRKDQRHNISITKL